MTTTTTKRSCYYCDDAGTETIVVGGVRYWFCPNHKQVLISWLEEDQQKKQAAALQLRKEIEAAGAKKPVARSFPE